MERTELMVSGKPLSTLRVVDLKQELDKRHLSKSGSKKELMDRLRQRLEFEALPQESVGTSEVPNTSVKDNVDGDNEYIKQYLADQKATYQKQLEIKQQIIMSSTEVIPEVNQVAANEALEKKAREEALESEANEARLAQERLAAEKEEARLREVAELEKKERESAEKRAKEEARAAEKKAKEEARLAEKKAKEEALAAEKAAKDALAAEKAAEKLAKENELKEKKAREKEALEKAAAEKKAKEKEEKERLAAEKKAKDEKLAAEKKAKEEKLAAEKKAREEEAREKKAQELEAKAKLAAEKKAKEAEAKEKQAAEKKAKEEEAKAKKAAAAEAKLREQAEKEKAKEAKVEAVAPKTSPKKSSDSAPREEPAQADAKPEVKAASEDLSKKSESGAKPERKRRWGSSKGDQATGSSLAPKREGLSRGISSDALKGLITVEKSAPAADEVSTDTKSSDADTQSKQKDSQVTAITPTSTNTTIPVSAHVSIPGKFSGASVATAGKENGAADKRDVRVVRKSATDEPVTETSARLSRKTSAATSAVEGAKENDDEPREPSPARNPPSSILFIKNLTRPFTVNQLNGLLSNHGEIDKEKFWIDKIKSKCYASYKTVEEATVARAALHGQRWPDANPKTLSVDFATEEDLQNQVEADKQAALPPKKVQEERPQRESGNAEKFDVVIKRGKDEGDVDLKRPVREWDREKLLKEREVSPSNKRRRSRSPRNQREDHARGDGVDKDKKRESDPKERIVPEESPAKLLDDLFQKTKSAPCIYWLPLTEEQAAVRSARREEIDKKRREEFELREAERNKRIEERQRRSPPRRDRSPFFGGGGGRGGGRGRERSPFGQRRPPPRVDRRSPPRRGGGRSRSRSRSGSSSRSRSPSPRPRSRSPFRGRGPPPGFRRPRSRSPGFANRRR